MTSISRVTPTLRVLRSESLSGITLVSGLTGVVAVLTMGVLADSSIYDPGGGNVLNVPLSFTYLLAPLFGGFTALRVGRLDAQGDLRFARSTPRGTRAVLLMSCTAMMAWALVSYLACVALMCLVIGVSGPWTTPMLLLPVCAVALMFLFILVGAVAGTATANVLTGPAVALIGLLALNALTAAPLPIKRFSPIYADKGYHFGTETNARLTGGVALFMAGLISVVLVAIALRPLSRKSIGFLVAALLLLTGSSLVATASADPLLPRTGSTGVCRDAEGVRLCVWGGRGERIESALLGIVRVRDDVSHVLEEPRYFYEAGLTHPKDAAEIAIAPERAPDPYAVAYAKQAMLAPSCSPSTERVREELVGLINELVSPGSTTTERPFSTGAAVATASAARQRSWAGPRLMSLARCAHHDNHPG